MLLPAQVLSNAKYALPGLFTPNPPVIDQSMKYTDFISITLTGLAVMLAILGISLAILGIFGYRAIINIAAEKAEVAALKRVEAFLQATDVNAMLKALVMRRVEEEGDRVYEDLSVTGGVGIPTYPKKEGESKE